MTVLEGNILRASNVVTLAIRKVLSIFMPTSLDKTHTAYFSALTLVIHKARRIMLATLQQPQLTVLTALALTIDKALCIMGTKKPRPTVFRDFAKVINRGKGLPRVPPLSATSGKVTATML